MPTLAGWPALPALLRLVAAAAALPFLACACDTGEAVQQYNMKVGREERTGGEEAAAVPHLGLRLQGSITWGGSTVGRLQYDGMGGYCRRLAFPPLVC